jgi:phage replication-related protein YjqB (UPF0714/DUF867 family)
VAELAGAEFDSYVFRGLMKRECYKNLHVTSTHYDEPLCAAMVRRAILAVAFHGCDARESVIEVGGGNRALAGDLRDFLRRSGFPAVDAPGGRSGTAVENFINAATRQGIQLELSAGFRKTLFPDYPRTLQRNQHTLPAFVDAMQRWLRAATLRLVSPDAAITG